MVDPVHVEFPCSCDADDLVEFLAARGLTASVTRSADHCELEVRHAVDPDARLHRDVETALAAWLEEGSHPLVPALNREHEYVLRPPAD
jgi:hypothetical protein